jgi:hypothetical protein
MGGAQRRLTKAGLEVMLGEFEVAERYGTIVSTVNKDLHQIRCDAMFGGPWRSGQERGAYRLSVVC